MTSVLGDGPFAKVPLHRFWVISDLQQSDPVNAKYCMHTGVEDFISLGIDVDAVCYLGDTTEGCNINHLREMADMQVEELAKVNAPVYYVMGNHEFEYHRHMEGPGSITIPMRERILNEKQWHTTKTVNDWSFSVDFGDLVIVLFSDRCAMDGSWCTGNGYHVSIPKEANVQHDHEADAAVERAKLEAINKPFFTFSHYAFAGGNRDKEGPIQHYIPPLPPALIAHFYGHCHIGDTYWGGENCLRQISTINDTAITQFDIASLENRRGSAVRSAVVEWYGGHSYGVFFRNHTQHYWEKTYTEWQ